MTDEALKKLAEEQVSILNYNGGNSIAACNGFILGFNYLSVVLHDLVNSPKFQELVKDNSDKVKSVNLDALQKSFAEQTFLSPTVVKSYSEFIAIFFKNCYDSGTEFALNLVQQLTKLD